MKLCGMPSGHSCPFSTRGSAMGDKKKAAEDAKALILQLKAVMKEVDQLVSALGSLVSILD